MRKRAPHGHPSFIKYAFDDVFLHSNKNYDYTGGGDALGNFKRVARILNNYPNFPYDSPRGVAIMNMIKQLDVIMWNMSKGHQMSEGRMTREQDIAIYATLLRCMEQEGV